MTPKPSCYKNNKLTDKCPNHYWNTMGLGICKLTNKIVKPETCKLASLWERDETQK